MLGVCLLARRRSPSVRYVHPLRRGGSLMSQPTHAVGNLSVEEFAVYDTPEGRSELVRGEVQMTPWPGGRHGVVVMRLAARLNLHVESRRLGEVVVGTSFELIQLPRTVRAPDIAFVHADRLPLGGVGPGFMRIAPDLAIEVVSTSERRARLQGKLDDYRASGVPLVWVIDPAARTATIHANSAPIERLTEHDALDGGTVIAGFRVPIDELFVGVTRG